MANVFPTSPFWQLIVHSVHCLVRSVASTTFSAVKILLCSHEEPPTLPKWTLRHTWSLRQIYYDPPIISTIKVHACTNTSIIRIRFFFICHGTSVYKGHFNYPLICVQIEICPIEYKNFQFQVTLCKPRGSLQRSFKGETSLQGKQISISTKKKFTGSICFAVYVQWSSWESFVFLTKAHHDI